MVLSLDDIQLIKCLSCFAVLLINLKKAHLYALFNRIVVLVEQKVLELLVEALQVPAEDILEEIQFRFGGQIVPMMCQQLSYDEPHRKVEDYSLIASNVNKGSIAAILSFWVIPAKSGNFFKKGEQFVEHVDAIAQDLEVKVVIWIFSHLGFGVEAIDRSNNVIPAIVDNSHLLVLFTGEKKFSDKVLIWFDQVIIDPSIITANIKGKGLEKLSELWNMDEQQMHQSQFLYLFDGLLVLQADVFDKLCWILSNFLYQI